MAQYPARLRGKGLRLWTVALLLAATFLTVTSVTVAAEDTPPPGQLTPLFGAATGGTHFFVTPITGASFSGVTAVTFGGTNATSFSVKPDGTLIGGFTPAHDPGLVDVVVTKADSTTVTVGHFLYVPATPPAALSITSVNPTTGSTGGHTPVVVVGGGFRPGVTLTFGGTAATDVQIYADALLVARTPAHVVGKVDVVVANHDGGSATLPQGFEYVTPPPAPAPTITAIAPASGPASSLNPSSTAIDDDHGLRVAIIGTGFQSGASITFGGVPVGHAEVFNSVIITSPPAHAVGKVDVVVTNPDNQSVTLANGFEYLAPTPSGPPVITKIDPATGPAGDRARTLVTITGSSFKHDATVSFGGVAAHDAEVVSDGLIIALAPTHTAGAVNVVVTNPDGQQATTQNGFTYVAPTPGAPPVVTHVDASTGDHGQRLVTITGTGFQPGATVKFGSALADHADVFGSTVIIAIAPNHDPGTVDVTVTNPDGLSSTLSNAYTYGAATPASLAIREIVPPVGPVTGGSQVYIRGTGFTAGMTVTFETTAVTVQFKSSTLLVVTAPSHPAGAVNVTVSDGKGNSVTANNGYAYFEPPTDRHTSGASPGGGGQPVNPIPTHR